MRYVDYSNMRYNGEQCGTAWGIYVTIMTTMPNVEAIIVSCRSLVDRLKCDRDTIVGELE